MATWRVETRATVRRVYVVEADDEHGAKDASRGVACDIEEDEDEVTVSIEADDKSTQQTA